MTYLQSHTMPPSLWYLLSVGIVCTTVTGTCEATIPTAGVYARLGGPVTVTWAMSPIKEFIVKKDYRVMFHISGNNKVTVADKELRTRVSTVSYARGTFSFHLYNVTSSDAGQYSCYVDSTHHGRTRINHCGQTLYVIDLQDPYIVTEEQLGGDRTLNLTCLCTLWISPDSSPSVAVVWTENDDRLYSGQRNHMLSSEVWSPVYDGRLVNYTSILSIRDGWQQSDKCKCRVGVKNVHSEWSEEIYPLYWSDENTNYTVVPEEDDATMTLKMPSLDRRSYITSPSGPHLMWKLADRWNVGHTFISRLEIRGTRPTSESVIVRLLLHNATGRDAGKYLCVSGHHHVPQCGHTLIVSRRPVKPTISATQQYQHMSLTCSSMSRSLPQDHNLAMTYSWRRGNTGLLSGWKYHMSGSTLTITDVRVDGSGNYSCQSTEVDGQASEWSSQFELNVQPGSNSTMTGTHTTSLGTIIGCSIAGITLLVAAVMLCVRRNDVRESWKRRFQNYIIPTENKAMSLQDLTDPDYEVIDETCTERPGEVEGHEVDGASCSLPETVIPVHPQTVVHQSGMSKGISEDERVSISECGVLVQEHDTVHHDDSLIPLDLKHDRDKGGQRDTSSAGSGWVTSPVDAHAGAVLRIMSDLDIIIAETITILNEREGRQTSTERYQKENVEFQYLKAIHESGDTTATQQERCSEFSIGPSLSNGVNAHDETPSQ